MILAGGQVYSAEKLPGILDGLEERINETLRSGSLLPDVVTDAVERLGKCAAAGEFDGLLAGLGLETSAIDRFRPLLSRKYLENKLETELGKDFSAPRKSGGICGLQGVNTRLMPLGTLFHIAAGNMDFLPAYTVIEGLLTGNVNLLKLPQTEGGATLLALRKLIDIEPRLADYVYVFDTPSSDLQTMRRLAALADGIAVWGSEEAVTAVRRFAPPGVKLIEWGHRLSFAYLSGDWESRPDELTALAGHIVQTEQLLCSSCQVIYLDTDGMKDVRDFCRVFLPCLEAARRKHPIQDIGAAAEMTLQRCTEELEALIAGQRATSDTAYQGFQCGLTACGDDELELSDLFARVKVKRLPSSEIMRVLRRQKGKLQTAGLLCGEDDRARLTELLVRAGVNRVTTVGGMSAVFAGESHDGEYALRRYVRMVNEE